MLRVNCKVSTVYSIAFKTLPLPQWYPLVCQLSKYQAVTVCTDGQFILCWEQMSCKAIKEYIDGKEDWGVSTDLKVSTKIFVLSELDPNGFNMSICSML